MKKIAIGVGHSVDDQGYHSPHLDMSEFNYNNMLADWILYHAQDHQDTEVKIFHRHHGGGYTTEARDVTGRADRWGARVFIELHFNAGGEGATGTETLSSGSNNSHVLAREVNHTMVATLGLRNRGVKTLSAGDNGHGMVMAGKAPAILIEPFFGSSRHDCDAANTDGMMSRLALSILRGALNAIDSMPRQDLKESRTIRNANDSQKAVIGGGALIGGAATINTATKVLQDAKAGVAGFGFDGQSLLIAVMALIVGGLVWKVWSDQSKIKKARHDDHVQGVR